MPGSAPSIGHVDDRRVRIAFTSEVYWSLLPLRDDLDALPDAAARWIVNALNRSGALEAREFLETWLHLERLIEAIVSRWSRLSLIFFDAGRAADRTRHRRRLMRELYDYVDPATAARDARPLLADRQLRDAWAHLDERLDAVLAAGHEGRRSYVIAYGIEDLSPIRALIPRIFNPETGTFYFHSQSGAQREVRLEHMKAAIDDLWDRHARACGGARYLTD